MPSCMSISSSPGPSPPGCRAVPEMLPALSCCCCCLLQALQEAIWTKWAGYLQQYLELPGRAWRSGPGAADLKQYLEQYLDLKQYSLELVRPWEGDIDLQQYPLRRGLGVGEALELARPWERRGVGLALATGGWPWEGSDPGDKKQAAAATLATGMEGICSARKTTTIAIQIRGSSVLSCLFTWSGRFLKRHIFRNRGSIIHTAMRNMTLQR